MWGQTLIIIVTLLGAQTFFWRDLRSDIKDLERKVDSLIKFLACNWESQS